MEKIRETHPNAYRPWDSAEDETREEAKSRFYAHGAESPLHQERYRSASDEDKAAFSQKLDEHLARQG